MDDPRKKLLRVDRTFLILSVVLGGLQAWISRYAMNPDGVSYLDIGDAYLRGDWKAAINGYWSPMYSVVLGTAMRILKPSIATGVPGRPPGELCCFPRSSILFSNISARRSAFDLEQNGERGREPWWCSG